MLIDGKDYCLGCFYIKEGATVCPACGWHDGMSMTVPGGPAPGEILDNRYVVGHILSMDEKEIAYLSMDIRTHVRFTMKVPTSVLSGRAVTYKAVPYREEALSDGAGEPKPPAQHPAKRSPSHSRGAAETAAAARQAGSTRRAARPVHREKKKKTSVIAAAAACTLTLAVVGVFVIPRLIPARDSGLEHDVPESMLAATQATPTFSATAPPPAATPPPETPVPTAAQLTWSEWDEAYADFAETPGYEVQQRTEYRQADVTVEYSVWSAWSPDRPGGDVQMDAEYRVRRLETRYTDQTYMEGFTPTGVVTQEWGPWSEWSDSAINPAEGTEVETRLSGEEERQTQYMYSRYLVPTPEGATYPSDHDPGGGIYQETDWLTAPLQSIGGGTYGSYFVDGVGEWFNERVMTPEAPPAQQHTQYRSRSLREVYEFRGYTPWSDWQSRQPSLATGDEMETRYRFRTRSEVTGAWSAWQEEPIEEAEGIIVEERVVYRYRETGA